MPSSEPRRRLQKLFRRSDQSATPSPPVSPSSPESRKHVRRTSSHGSLKDWVQTVGRKSSVSGKRISSGNPFTPRAQAPGARPHSPGRVLPEVPRQDDVETELQGLSLSDDVEKRASSKDVADSNNAARRQPRKLQVPKPLPDTPDQSMNDSDPDANATDAARTRAYLPVSGSQHTADNATASQPDEAMVGGLHDIPDPLKLSKSKQNSNDWRSTSPTSDRPDHAGNGMIPSRKPVPQTEQGLPMNGRPATAQLEARPTSAGSNDGSQKLSRGMPLMDNVYTSKDRYEEPPPPPVHDELESLAGGERAYEIKDSKTPIDLNGIVNLENTEETHLHERWAPAVTHETVVQNVHEIREEHITREIHNHEVHHRILPIVDIEVLPARHFVPVEGGYAEISEKEIPGRTGANAQWLIAEMVSKMAPKGQKSVGVRDFTARKFEDGEGDTKQYTAPEGHQRTEEWWVHPPTLETGARDSGQTYPFHFGSANPADDGLRAKLPPGGIIGSSPALAEQQRLQRSGNEETVSQVPEPGAAEIPPPVPPHKSMVSVLNRSRPISRDGTRNRDGYVFDP